MARFLFSGSDVFLRKFGRFLVALFWVAGLVFGALSADFTGVSSSFLLRNAVSASVSALGLFCCLLLPLLLSAYAVYSSSRWLLFAVAFGKGFCYSWVAATVSLAFGSYGWLVRFFFLFSDSIFLVLLCGFWLLYAAGDRKLSLRVCAVVVLAGAVVSGVDCWLIVPFLRSFVF